MDSERQSRKLKKCDCLERTAFERYGSLVPSPNSAVPPFWGGVSSKMVDSGDGSGTRLEIWRENSEKANMRLMLFPRTTKLRSMVGCNREVPSPVFHSGGASPQCGVWW